MDNYVYFGKRSHFSHLANTSSNLQKSDALTATNFGIVPANFSAGTSTDAVRGIEVLIVAKEANGSTRGTAISALKDVATGAAFASPVATTAINDVSRMIWDAVGISSGVLTIANFGADGTNGYLIDAADQWIIREFIGSTNDDLSDVPAIQQAGCFNMNRFRGCDPVDTSTAATIGVDVKFGTAGSYEVEKTKIIFDGGDGGATQDYVVLTHAANKFKDICTAMETLRNGSYAKQGDGMYTFTDLMSGGTTFWDNEFGIVGCHMVNTTL
tara:strand:+ start:376 stop:1185 length:810 start_codon:yes stop_codon:yes gene_type:complete